MKIGAGGLQSLAQYDAVARRTEGADRVNPARELAQNPAPNDPRDLLRAVERLNRMAEMFNQQVVFRLNRDRKGKGHRIWMVNKETDETILEVDAAELPALARQFSNAVGLVIDTET